MSESSCKEGHLLVQFDSRWRPLRRLLHAWHLLRRLPPSLFIGLLCYLLAFLFRQKAFMHFLSRYQRALSGRWRGSQNEPLSEKVIEWQQSACEKKKLFLFVFWFATPLSTLVRVPRVCGSENEALQKSIRLQLILVESVPIQKKRARAA